MSVGEPACLFFRPCVTIESLDMARLARCLDCNVDGQTKMNMLLVGQKNQFFLMTMPQQKARNATNNGTTTPLTKYTALVTVLGTRWGGMGSIMCRISGDCNQLSVEVGGGQCNFFIHLAQYLVKWRNFALSKP